MLKIEATLKAEQKAREILENRKKEKKNLVDWIEQERKKINAINSTIEQATIEGDLEAYQKAKAERADVMDSKEMHERRLSMLNNEPLLSKGDYEEAIREIYAEIAAQDDITKQTLRRLSEEMEKAATDLQDALNKANEVLRFLQHDIYKDADRSRNEKGVMLMIPSEEKHLDKWETVNWGMTAVMSHQYESYSGRKVTR
jgi:hypothetical protein